jgi:hypothetical protein
MCAYDKLWVFPGPNFRDMYDSTKSLEQKEKMYDIYDIGTQDIYAVKGIPDPFNPYTRTTDVFRFSTRTASLWVAQPHRKEMPAIWHRNEFENEETR